MKNRSPQFAFTLIELLVVISIIAILAGIALPVFSQVTERGAQTKDLSNAKQVGLACKLYASDNDGKYPNMTGQADTPVAGSKTSTSNDILASLVPDYVPTEKIFYLAKSAWSPNIPDENIKLPADRLETGSNNFAYMFGLNDTSNPSFPLIFDAPMEGATTYSTNEATKGGVWKGKKAIVIRCDQSGSIEKCKVNIGAGTSIIEGPTGGAQKADILIPVTADNWMDTTTNGICYPN